MILRLDDDGPLYAQVFRALRGSILEGEMTAGQRLPSSRELARDANLSRNTVLQAYELLVEEGYAVTRSGAGTWVADDLPEAETRMGAGRPRAAESPDASLRQAKLSGHATRLLDAWGRNRASWRFDRPRLRYDFRYGEPRYEDFPLATWSRLLEASARSISRDDLGYGDGAGHPRLRSALAGYVTRSRGVACEPDDVIVVYGTQQAIDLVTRVVVDAGDRVAVEEPGHRSFTIALEAVGAERVPIPVDEHGLDVEALSSEADVSLVCLTPSHQFPTGGVMPVERRLRLLDWADRADAYVLEDDYDSEFNFEGRPVESLQGLDHAGRVIYTGTLSKVMFPALRLGFIVPPRELAPAILASKVMADAGCSGIEQRAAAAFIEEGHFDSHLRRSRTRNARKREVLLEALRDELGDRVRVTGAHAGLHVMLWLSGRPAADAQDLCRRARAVDVGIYPAKTFFMQPPDEAVLLLGYGALDEESIREGVRRFASLLDA